MTNLSKELCEICGIEPERDCTNCPHPCETACNNCSYGELVYPDFENNNNNFVKLLEIFHKNNFYINDISINCVIEKETFVVYFLKYLIKVLTDETSSEKVKDVLKQAIKNEQWEV